MTREERAALIGVLVREVETYHSELISREEETQGVDEDETRYYGPSDFYWWDEDKLARRLGAPLLGYGGSRVVVELPDGTVAKLPWGEGGRISTSNEIAVWENASPRLREMLLPPLDYLPDLGTSVFPQVIVLDEEYDAELQANLVRRLRALAGGRVRFADLRAENSGIYTDPATGEQRVVLIDYAE